MFLRLALLAVLPALAACQTERHVIVSFPGTDTSSARFKQDRLACKFEASKATARMYNYDRRMAAYANVAQACMEARGYDSKTRIEWR
jgi:hypothetical protein